MDACCLRHGLPEGEGVGTISGTPSRKMMRLSSASACWVSFYI